MLNLHLGYLEELDSLGKGNPFADLFIGRDSDDGQEDTSIVAPGTGGDGETIFPFQLVASGDSQTLYVRYGTVSTEVPVIGATPLVADYTQNVLSFSASGTTNFYLEATFTITDGISSISTASIQTSTTSDNEFYSSRLLGTVAASGGSITSIANAVQGSQNVDSCGPLHSWNLV